LPAGLALVAAVGLAAGWFLYKGFWGTNKGDSVSPAEKAVLVEPTHHDFGLKVTLPGAAVGDRGELRLVEGQRVTFRIEVDHDAYVGIWNVAPDGRITQVFPNEHETDHLFKAGKPQIVPDPALTAKKGVVIDAEYSGGQERVWVAASTKPWDPLQGERDGPYTLFKTPEQRRELEGKLRGFRVRANDPQGGAQLAEEMLRYRVEKKADRP
jgi:hypothetical protein